MEDVPKIDEEEQKLNKKSKRSSFLDSWRRLIGTGEKTKDEQKTEDLLPFSDRAWQAIKSFLGIESPDVVKPYEEILDKNPEMAVDSNITVAHIDDEESLGNVSLSEVYDETDKQLPETNTADAQSLEGGELIIEHDDMPDSDEYYAYEKLIPTYEQEELPALKQSEKVSSAPPERIGSIVDRLETRTLSSIAGIDQQSRRRDQKLKREIVKIKDKSKKEENKIRTLEDEQRAFRAIAEQEINRSEIEKLKLRQQMQRTNLMEKRNIPTAVSITSPKEGSERVEQQSSREIHTNRPEILERPEEVLNTVKEAAEYDVPIESAYERRHEVKDKAGNGGAIQSSSGGNYPVAVPVQITTTRASERNPGYHNSNDADIFRPITDNSMYKNAAKTGFWTALVLLVIMFVIYIIR